MHRFFQLRDTRWWPYFVWVVACIATVFTQFGLDDPCKPSEEPSILSYAILTLIIVMVVAHLTCPTLFGWYVLGVTSFVVAGMVLLPLIFYINIRPDPIFWDEKNPEIMKQFMTCFSILATLHIACVIAVIRSKPQQKAMTKASELHS
jgi:hypothetical protein